MKHSALIINFVCETPDAGALEPDINEFFSKAKPLSKFTTREFFGRGYNYHDNLEHIANSNEKNDFAPVMRGSLNIRLTLQKQYELNAENILASLFLLAKDQGLCKAHATVSRNYFE